MSAPAPLRGTCPVCFREMDVRHERIARHGWEEAGGRRRGEYGNTWHTGACWGVRRTPFELSPDGTWFYLREVHWPYALQLGGQVEHLRARPEIAVEYKYDTGERLPGKRWGTRHETRSVRLRPGDERVEVEIDVHGRTYRYGYEHELHWQLAQVERAFWAVSTEGLRLYEAAASWKPGKLRPKVRKATIVHRCYPERRRYAYGYIACGNRSRVPVTTEVDEEVTCSRCLKALAARGK